MLLSRSPSTLHKPFVLLPGSRRRPPLSGGQGQLEVGLQPQGFVDHVRGLQAVPLGKGPTWVGQHVRPVPQLVTRGPAAQEEFADGLVLGDFVVIPNGDDHIHVLGGDTQERRSVGGGLPQRGPAQPWAQQGNPPGSD